MTLEELAEKIKRLEFHQQLLLKMVETTSLKFDYLIVKKSLNQEEVNRILAFCEALSIKLQKQKAEGFVYFLPLYQELEAFLEPKLKAEKVITACLEQGLYVPLMQELKKFTRP